MLSSSAIVWRMKYESHYALRDDARSVSKGVFIPQSQESLEDQLRDLRDLANHFGLYDAADYLRGHSVRSDWPEDD